MYLVRINQRSSKDSDEGKKCPNRRVARISPSRRANLMHSFIAKFLIKEVGRHPWPHPQISRLIVVTSKSGCRSNRKCTWRHGSVGLVALLMIIMFHIKIRSDATQFIMTGVQCALRSSFPVIKQANLNMISTS